VKPLVPQSGRDVCRLSFSAIALQREKIWRHAVAFYESKALEALTR